MLGIWSEQTYKDGDLIIREGTRVDKIYVILKGAVEICRIVDKRKVIVGFLKKGEIFGELAFFTHVRHMTTAYAVGDVTVGIVDDGSLKNEFRGLSKEFRSLVVSMAKGYLNLIDKIDEFSKREKDRALKIISLTYRDIRSFLRAYTGYMNNGGLFIKTSNPLDQGEEFLLKLKLSGVSNPLKVRCEVAWTRVSGKDTGALPSGMLVMFCAMPKRDDDILKQYVKKWSQELGIKAGNEAYSLPGGGSGRSIGHGYKGSVSEDEQSRESRPSSDPLDFLEITI